jgi:hypothetical protein
VATAAVIPIYTHVSRKPAAMAAAALTQLVVGSLPGEQSVDAPEHAPARHCASLTTSTTAHACPVAGVNRPCRQRDRIPSRCGDLDAPVALQASRKGSLCGAE